MPSPYDVLVIGAGTGGYVAAIRAAQLGKRVAVVEKQKSLGGTCLIWGCIPTKALLEHAHAFKVVKDSDEWGIAIPYGAPAIDMRQVHARKDKVVSGLTRGVEFLFKKNKIDWIKGTARLGGNGRVDVFEGDRQTLEAKDIIIATGSSPRSVPGIEIDHRRIITSDDAIHLPQVPESLVVLGSGAVGVEFASIFRRFGSDVTLIELLPRLVPAEDAAISAELEKSFRRQGIRSLTGTKVTKATATPAGVEVEAQTTDGKTETIRRIAFSSRSDGVLSRADWRSRRSASRWRKASSRSIRCTARRCRTCRRSATSLRSTAWCTRSLPTFHRPKGFSWPSGLPARRCSRSTMATYPAARTAIPRLAASA